MFSQVLGGLRGHCSCMNVYGNILFCLLTWLLLEQSHCFVCVQSIFKQRGFLWDKSPFFHKLLTLVCLQEATDLKLGRHYTQNVPRRINRLWTSQTNTLWFRRSTRSWSSTSSTPSPPTTPP